MALQYHTNIAKGAACRRGKLPSVVKAVIHLETPRTYQEVIPTA
jgi:hypothetical protein